MNQGLNQFDKNFSFSKQPIQAIEELWNTSNLFIDLIGTQNPESFSSYESLKFLSYLANLIGSPKIFSYQSKVIIPTKLETLASYFIE